MYLFIIYSCVKNLSKANDLYNLISRRLQDCECYIMFGVPSLIDLYRFEDNKYLHIKCRDDYENLCEKTITLCKAIKDAFPNADGVFKCDDDIIPSISNINMLIEFIRKHKLDYVGKQISYPRTEYDLGYYNKISRINNVRITNYKYKVIKCHYAAGPMYYLSMNSIIIISNTIVDFNQIVSEDNMVGSILNNHNIFPFNLQNVYLDHLTGGAQTLHNHNFLHKIYVLLNGGLGNQLFQVSAVYEIAKKHHMIPILLYKKEYQESEYECMKTIFSFFNHTYFENIDCSTITTYNEDRCFDYEANVVSKKTDYLINGYFQNKKYGLDIEMSIFRNTIMSELLLMQYPLLDNSYFIHVRIGKPSDFDKELYYKRAIDYILSIDDNPHFFILSDDVSFCRDFEAFNNINKTIIDEPKTLNAFYFMSLCKRGGICANSTFSGWASKLNTNNSKIVICPKQWTNISYHYEIPFDYTISF